MRQKLLVRAIGSIMLIEPVQQTVITSRRIHVVDDSYFVRYRAGKTVPAITPQLEVFDAPIKDSATDEELARFFKDSDGDENLAMNAFLSKYAEGVPDEETDEEREARVAREANQQSGAAFQTEPTTEGQQGATEGQQGTEGQGSGDGSQGAEGQGSGDGTTPPVEDATKTPVEGTTPPTEDAAKTTADAAKPAARRLG